MKHTETNDMNKIQLGGSEVTQGWGQRDKYWAGVQDNTGDRSDNHCGQEVKLDMIHQDSDIKIKQETDLQYKRCRVTGNREHRT